MQLLKSLEMSHVSADKWHGKHVCTIREKPAGLIRFVVIYHTSHAIAKVVNITFAPQVRWLYCGFLVKD